MLRYTVRRAASSLLVLWAMATVVFALSVYLMPGDAPFWERYPLWLGDLLSGNLATARSGASVWPIVGRVLPWTLLLLLVGVGGAMGVGLVVGRWLGWRQTWPRETGLMGAAGASLIFPPWLLLVLAFVAAQFMGAWPFLRFRVLDIRLWETGGLSLVGTMWFLVITLAAGWALVWSVGRVLRRQPGLARGASQLLATALVAAAILSLVPAVRIAEIVGVVVIPLIVVMLINSGDTALLAATLTTTERSAPYVMTARAKGLTESAVRRRHVGRNVILPVLSRFVATLPLVFGLLLIVETSARTQFGYAIALPGLSSMVLDSLVGRNIPVMLAGILAVGVVTLLLRLVLDILQVMLDPRLRQDVAPGGQS